MRAGPSLASPRATRDFLSAQLRDLEHEVFCCLYLDKRHRLIQFEELFRGTIDGASVHPREIVKLALQRNSAAVIIAHNHPSGVAEPSQADELITQRVKEALGAGRHPPARSHHRRRRRQRVAGGAWIALKNGGGAALDSRLHLRENPRRSSRKDVALSRVSNFVLGSRRRSLQATCALILGLSGSPGHAASPPSVEDFASRSHIEGVSMSPDGRYLALIQTLDGRALVVVAERLGGKDQPCARC